MAISTLPKTRSMAALEGQYLFHGEDSPFNLGRFNNTAVPAGSKGRPVAVGSKLYEPADMSKPIKLWGSNVAFAGPHLEKQYAVEAARKYRSRGMNYIRIHGAEMYLMMGGDASGSAVIRGTRNYSAQRWDELDFYLAELVKAGVYFSFGIMSSNLATDIGNLTDRWATRESYGANDAGTITVVVAADGSVTATCTGTSNHYVPPAIYVNGGGGVGMKLKCTINGAGQVNSPLTVVDNGRGYTPGTYTDIAKFYGGRGTLKRRMFLPQDPFARDEYAQTLYDILNHYNPYLGCKYKDCPALWLVEAFNESTFVTLENVLTLYHPMFREWLESAVDPATGQKRYANIAALNAKWGTSYTSFGDLTLTPMGGSGPGDSTTASKWRAADTFYWRSEVDVAHFQFCEQAARAAGWTGITSAADLYGSPAMSRTNTLSGASIQNAHYYFSLCDSFASGDRISTAVVPINTTGARNPAGLFSCLNAMDPDKPIVFTEINSPYPNRYRAEAGPAYAGLLSMYGVSAVVWCGDSIFGLKWGGAAYNRQRTRGQWPLQTGNDPYVMLGINFGALAFLRGDVSERPVDEVRILNDRALSYYANTSDPGIAVGGPVHGYKQIMGSVEDRVSCMVGRINTKYYPTSDPTYGTQAYAAAWLAAVDVQPLQQAIKFANGGETQRWLAEDPRNTGLNAAGEFLYNALMFTKDNSFFFDTLAGVSGLNTPRTQTATIYSKFTRKSGSRHRRGKGYSAASPALADKAVPAPSYEKNIFGTRYWSNMEIDYADDGVFIGIASYDDRPISESTRILVGCGGRSYNTGATWKSSQKTIKTVTVVDNKNINFTSPPVITATSNNSNTFEQGNEFYAVGVLSGGNTGTLIDVKIINSGNNYPDTTTVAVSGQPTIVLSCVLEDDDPQKEIMINTPYLADGNEGWPVLQSCILARFNVRGIDTSRPWALYEYDFAGNRVGVHPTKKIPAVMDGATVVKPAGIQVRIETTKLSGPSLYFTLEQVSAPARKKRPA